MATLKEHLDLLGLEVPHFAYMTAVPETVIQKALKGEPIAQVHAEQIVQKLNKQHGLPPATGSLHQGQGLQVSDIDGLKTIDPESLRSKKPVAHQW